MSKLLNCLLNKDSSYVPIWFMRQAGRYLPEFRNIRSNNSDFLNLCYNSKLASEITLQPIKRFNLDAAIIFSDILVVPHALGQQVIFEKGATPQIKDININKLLNTKVKEFINKLKPVYDAIKLTRKNLDKKKSLIGFVGAPWTLMIYLLNLKHNNKINEEKLFEEKDNIELILKKLDECLKEHIFHQKKAGADIIQIFDSWAGLIPTKLLSQYCFEPNKSLVKFCRSNKVASICFPKGIKETYVDFVNIVGPDGINIDSDINPMWASTHLKNICLQGGMNPEFLLKDDKLIIDEVDKYLSIFKNNAYIFNLGHGILPDTNPETVKKIVERIRKTK